MSQVSLNNSPAVPLDPQNQAEGAAPNAPAHPAMIPHNLTAPIQARQQGAQQVVNQPLQQHAGQVAPNSKGFFATLARWFTNFLSLLSSQASASAPPIVPPQEGVALQDPVPSPPPVLVSMPDGQIAQFERSELTTMIEALPRELQDGDLEDLRAILSHRLKNGQELLSNIKEGKEMGPATASQVSDLMLFISTAVKVSGAKFASGAFSVEDPHGRLANFLYGCPEAYQRSSSHMKEAQTALINGRVNIHRGIDIKLGLTGLPNARSTLLFAGIPGEHGAPSRLFLKMEWHGCRISPILRPIFFQPSDPNALPNRPLRKGDFFDSAGHLFDFFRTLGAGSAPGTRKEHIPHDVKTEYKKLLKTYEGTSYHHHLTKNNPTASTSGVHIMLENIKNVTNAVKGHPGQLSAFKFQTQALRDAMSTIDELNDLDTRIGNEVSRNLDDLLNVKEFEPMEPAKKLEIIDQKIGFK